MSHSIHEPRLKYSTRLAAAGAMCAATISASAAVTSVPTNVFQSEGSGFFSFNPLGNDFVADYNPNYTAGMRNCGLNLLNFNSSVFQWVPYLLSEGDVVGSSQQFTQNSMFLSYLSGGEVKYAGYRVQGAGNETYYGYVQLTGEVGDNFTIDAYRFESTPDTAITTSAVPEPSSIFFGISAVSVMTMRRRRKI
jgi:hypothetical protein